MIIKEIIHKPEWKTKSAIVELGYDELRDIANACYEESKKNDNSKDVSFMKTYRNMFFLFDLVKNGCIDGATISVLSKIQAQIQKAEKENDG